MKKSDKLANFAVKIKKTLIYQLNYDVQRKPSVISDCQ